MDKRAISDMISYYHNEPWVAHTLKVFGYAQGIAAGENLSGEELEALEYAALFHDVGIPEGLDVIKDKDIPQVVKWALAEANPVYPVPVVYTKERCASDIRRIQKGQ